MFDFWRGAEAALPLNVHCIRCERMVMDLTGEMRPLLAFLGMAWEDKAPDNQGEPRGHIQAVSYPQVGERIFRGAAGR